LVLYWPTKRSQNIAYQKYGGGMRQVGYLAAAGYTLDNNIERLSEDHRRAKEIAEV
jgi:threonine aldolase